MDTRDRIRAKRAMAAKARRFATLSPAGDTDRLLRLARDFDSEADALERAVLPTAKAGSIAPLQTT